MSRERTAVKSSLIGILSQFLTLIIKFIVRTIIIRYLGREILGLDAVIIDLISMLSLADMGINTAMLYRLYQPVVNQEQARIAQLMASYRFIFRTIAGVIAAIGLVLSCFLPLFIKGLSYSWFYIYGAYYLQLLAIVASYLFSYQRILLDADQKSYLNMLIDMLTFLGFGIVEILALLVFKEYFAYLILAVIQPLGANLIISWRIKALYGQEITQGKVKKADLRQLFLDAKEVLVNKIAGYIYNSTDSLVISVALGTAFVGLMSNYRYLSRAMISLVNSMMAAMQSLIGNFLNSNHDQKRTFAVLQYYSFVRFIVGGVAFVVIVSCSQDFILLWTGKREYLLSLWVPLLMMVDFYFGVMLGPLSEYLLGLGMFKRTRQISTVGAVVNILLSLGCVWTIGYLGVLIGTVISQAIMWSLDVYSVFGTIFKANSSWLKIYLQDQFKYLGIIFCATGLVLLSANYLFKIDYFSTITRLISEGLLAVLFFGLFTFLTFRKTPNYGYVLALLKKILAR
ncbi:oligosaccharide flippase family protein [Lactobacillus sp. DCY120]|uniref:Oligosaccharide flippase family protein n=1 Tax=Bombilactobacillus apium TaxID=2675299 RepID=A0A850R6D0_9LACO|nr:oligosaccharide flippase family protein [Bombilactobacillus apium]NVY96192.1 oligosaccharide flippase family protein [Bombilactobacillus apium]